MNENNEMPVGFMMELSKNAKAMEYFSGLSTEDQAKAIQQAVQAESRTEMQQYVADLAKR